MADVRLYIQQFAHRVCSQGLDRTVNVSDAHSAVYLYRFLEKGVEHDPDIDLTQPGFCQTTGRALYLIKTNMLQV